MRKKTIKLFANVRENSPAGNINSVLWFFMRQSVSCTHCCADAAFSCAAEFLETPARSIPKYFSMIARPIGLKVIEQRVKDQRSARLSFCVVSCDRARCRYDTLEQVEADLDLMLSNCRSYNNVNQFGGGYITMAANLERKLTKKLRKMKEKV